jgi:predicted DNA-binding transcriptional regulator AlpA
MSLKSDAIAYPPRGLSREEAARYVGVSTFKLDQMIADRRMPKPRQIDGRVVWDRVELDIAFSELPHQGHRNFFDKAS